MHVCFLTKFKNFSIWWDVKFIYLYGKATFYLNTASKLDVTSFQRLNANCIFFVKEITCVSLDDVGIISLFLLVAYKVSLLWGYKLLCDSNLQLREVNSKMICNLFHTPGYIKRWNKRQWCFICQFLTLPWCVCFCVSSKCNNKSWLWCMMMKFWIMISMSGLLHPLLWSLFMIEH